MDPGLNVIVQDPSIESARAIHRRRFIQLSGGLGRAVTSPHGAPRTRFPLYSGFRCSWKYRRMASCMYVQLIPLATCGCSGSMSKS